MNNETLLHEEIKSELEGLNGIDLGTDEYKTTVDGVTKLIDRAIEIEKLNLEYQEKEKKREEELNLKLVQEEETKRDRWIRFGISAAEILIPSVITIWGVVKSFEFEKEGTITTGIGRGFINKLIPRK